MKRPDTVCWSLGIQLYIGSVAAIEKGLRDVYNTTSLVQSKESLPNMCLVLFSTPAHNVYAVADDYSAENLDASLLNDLGLTEVCRVKVYEAPKSKPTLTLVK